jgi:hypothetical protein
MKLQVSKASIKRFNFEKGRFEKYIQYFAEYKIGQATFRPAFRSMGELKKWAVTRKHTIIKDT